MRALLSQQELQTFLRYDQHSGDFTWITKPKLANRVTVGTLAGYKSKAGYVQIRLGGTLYYAHRLAFLYMTGTLPTEQVDHINGNPADTSWDNLRLATSTDNQRNTAISKNNSSGVVGVCWDKSKHLWLARIYANSKEHFLGYFTELSEATQCRKAAEVTYGYHPNHGRNSI